MLISLFPKTHARYESLLLLGGYLQDLCSWLEVRGYPPNAICRVDGGIKRQQFRLLAPG